MCSSRLPTITLSTYGTSCLRRNGKPLTALASISNTLSVGSSDAARQRIRQPIVGHAGLGHLEATSEVELAYVFDEPQWGKGLATEAASAILAYGFATIGLERIVAVAFPENRRSIDVMKRCGMTSCGIATHFGRDVVKYEINAPERGCVPLGVGHGPAG